MPQLPRRNTLLVSTMSSMMDCLEEKRAMRWDFHLSSIFISHPHHSRFNMFHTAILVSRLLPLITTLNSLPHSCRLLGRWSLHKTPLSCVFILFVQNS